MTIRDATINDALEIQQLVFEAVGDFPHEDFNQEGWDFFLQANSLANTVARLQDERFVTLCYEVDQKLVGLLSIFNAEKVDQLFVLPSYQRMGIAKALWLDILKRHSSELKFLWVKSSTRALPIYQRFGFNLKGERQSSNGVSYYLLERTS